MSSNVDDGDADLLHKECLKACTRFYDVKPKNDGKPNVMEHERRCISKERFISILASAAERVIKEDRYDTLFHATSADLSLHQLAPFVDASFLYFCVAKERTCAQTYSFHRAINNSVTSSRSERPQNRKRRRSGGSQLLQERRLWLEYPHFLFELLSNEMAAYEPNNQDRRHRMFRALTFHIVHGIDLKSCIKKYQIVGKNEFESFAKLCTARLVHCFGEHQNINEDKQWDRVEMIINHGIDLHHKLVAIQRIRGCLDLTSFKYDSKPRASSKKDKQNLQEDASSNSFSGRRILTRSRSRSLAPTLSTADAHAVPENNGTNSVQQAQAITEPISQLERTSSVLHDNCENENGYKTRPKRTQKSRASTPIPTAKRTELKGKQCSSRQRSRSLAPKIERKKRVTTNRKKQNTLEPSKNASLETLTSSKTKKRRSRNGMSPAPSTTEAERKPPRNKKKMDAPPLESHISSDNVDTSLSELVPSKRPRGRPRKQPSMVGPTNTLKWNSMEEKHEKENQIEVARNYLRDTFIDDHLLSDDISIEHMPFDQQWHDGHNLLLVINHHLKGELRWHERDPEKNPKLWEQWLNARQFWDRYTKILLGNKDLEVICQWHLKQTDMIESNDQNADSGLGTSPVNFSNSNGQHEGIYADLPTEELMGKLFPPVVGSGDAWLCGTMFEFKAYLLNILFHGYNGHPEPLLSALYMICIFDCPLRQIAKYYCIPLAILVKALRFVVRFVDLNKLCIVLDTEHQVTMSPTTSIFARQITMDGTEEGCNQEAMMDSDGINTASCSSSSLTLALPSSSRSDHSTL